MYAIALGVKTSIFVITHRNAHRLIVAVMTIILALTIVACGSSPEKLADAFPCSVQVTVSDPADLNKVVEDTFPNWFVSNTRSFGGERNAFKDEWHRLILLRSGATEPVPAGTVLKVPARCPKDTTAKGKGES